LDAIGTSHSAPGKYSGSPTIGILALVADGSVCRGTAVNREAFNPRTAPMPSPDPGDTKVLQCADAAQADFIVTGNGRHFPFAPYGVAQVIRAGEPLVRNAPALQ
jgi:hypothetical protein